MSTGSGSDEMSTDFRQLFQAMQRRPSMYVLDGRFLTLVAYVDGCDAATDGALLRGFRDWLYPTRVGTSKPSLTWPAVLKFARGLQGELTQEEHERLIDDTFAALDEFLASHDHVFAVTTPTER